jgi:1-acyl-sn-glycerol-3-phosphate acyltransferase
MAWMRMLLIVLVARPLAKILTGADILGRENLPVRGPAIVAANHNSHVDTFLLLALFPARTLARVRPAAAADYFLSKPLISWVSRHIIGIVPVERDKVGKGVDVLAPAREALAAGDIVVIFPEGTRGSAGDVMGPLKGGIARLAAAYPDAPVTPIWIQGAGRVLPKGKRVPVPMTCCVVVGEAIRWGGDRAAFMAELKSKLEALRALAPPLRWRDDDQEEGPN